MPAGASPKREREYKKLVKEFQQTDIYSSREEEVAAKIVNKQRRENNEPRIQKMINKCSNLLPILLTLCLSTSINVHANEATKKQEALSEDAIDAQFENSKKTCEQKKEALQEICIVEAEGNREVAKAKLKAKLESTLENRVDYRVALAEAKYTLSVKKCQQSKNKESCTHKAQVLRDKETEDARAVRD